MKNVTYRNESEHFYFHDSELKYAKWENTTLILYFDFFYMLSSHPDNETGNHIQIDNAIMRFENAKINLCQWHDYTKAHANAFEEGKKNGKTSGVFQTNPDDIEIHDIDIIDALNKVIILHFDITKPSENYNIKINCLGIYGTKHSYNNYIIELEYSDLYVSFDYPSPVKLSYPVPPNLKSVKYRNELEHFVFHDCELKYANWENTALILYFDFFSYYPDNKTGNHIQIYNAVMCFENAKVNLCQWHDSTKAAAKAFEEGKKSGKLGRFVNFNPDEIEIHDIDIFDALNKIIIIDFDITKITENYNIKIKGLGIRDTKYNSSRIIEFEYSDLYLYFDFPQT